MTEDSSPPAPSTSTFSCKESLLACPKCKARMEPMLLTVKEDGSQDVWWTCSNVKLKSCTFPLDMPSDIYWVTRSSADREKDVVPLPRLDKLPAKYHHLYPFLFPAGRYNKNHDSRQSSLESVSSRGSSSSAASVDVEDVNSDNVRRRLSRIPRARVVMRDVMIQVPKEGTDVQNRTLAHYAARYEVTRRPVMIGMGCLQPDTSPATYRKLLDEHKLRREAEKASSDTSELLFTKHSPTQVLKYARARQAELAAKRKAEAAEQAQGREVDEAEIDEMVRRKLIKIKREAKRRKLESRSHKSDSGSSQLASLPLSQGVPLSDFDEDPMAALEREWGGIEGGLFGNSGGGEEGTGGSRRTREEEEADSAGVHSYASTPSQIDGAVSPGDASYRGDVSVFDSNSALNVNDEFDLLGDDFNLDDDMLLFY